MDSIEVKELGKVIGLPSIGECSEPLKSDQQRLRTWSWGSRKETKDLGDFI